MLKKKSVKKPVNLIVDIPIKNYEDTKYIENICDMILPNLYLGDLFAANCYDKMKDFDVIINVTTHKTQKFDNKLHIDIPLNDKSDVPLQPVLDWILDEIHTFYQENKKIFIHCRAGISRSVSIVVAYLIKYHKFDYDTAIEFISSKRNQLTSPNIGFKLQLIDFQKLNNNI